MLFPSNTSLVEGFYELPFRSRHRLLTAADQRAIAPGGNAVAGLAENSGAVHVLRGSRTHKVEVRAQGLLRHVRSCYQASCSGTSLGAFSNLPAGLVGLKRREVAASCTGVPNSGASIITQTAAVSLRSATALRALVRGGRFDLPDGVNRDVNGVADAKEQRTRVLQAPAYVR